MMQLLRMSPGLLVWVAIFSLSALVLLTVALLMNRTGMSLRPVYWFAGFLLLIGFPQFLGHLYLALKYGQEGAPRVAALEQIAASADSAQRRQAVQSLFGADADPDLVVDARKVFDDALVNAQVAQFASLSKGETVLLARFAGYRAAEKGWVAYLRAAGLSGLAGQGDSQRGFAVTRPVGDRAYALHLNDMVGVWTGPDDATIRRRMVAGGFTPPRRAPLAPIHEEPKVSKAEADQTAPAAQARLHPGLLAGLLPVYLFLVVLYFFKGAAWAGSRPAKPGVRSAPVAELANHLQSVNVLDVPLKVEPGMNEREWIASWRYADAKWIDLARARGMRRSHRIRLQLDEANYVVRATDYSSSWDWSAGRGGVEAEWKSELGLTFFKYEHQRVFGLQLDEAGRFKPELSYAYTFNLEEMKAPLIDAVTSLGWKWRPVVWTGPTWLRWLTE